MSQLLHDMDKICDKITDDKTAPMGARAMRRISALASMRSMGMARARRRPPVSRPPPPPPPASPTSVVMEHPAGRALKTSPRPPPKKGSPKKGSPNRDSAMAHKFGCRDDSLYWRSAGRNRAIADDCVGTDRHMMTRKGKIWSWMLAVILYAPGSASAFGRGSLQQLTELVSARHAEEDIAQAFAGWVIAHDGVSERRERHVWSECQCLEMPA